MLDQGVKLEVEVDEHELASSNLSREMFLLKDVLLRLETPKLDKVDRKLRSHIEKYMGDPVTFRISTKLTKFGRRAFCKTADGKKLRANWRENPSEDTKIFNVGVLDMPYDEALRASNGYAELEVQLPPLKRGGKIPSVVYSIPFSFGSVSPRSIVPRMAGEVRIYPKGIDSEPIESGPARAALEFKPNLVDPGWARGRPIFRAGRRKGFL